jgi:general secretion pathway protein J
MRVPTNQRRATAFTLLEVLIAVAVFAVVLAAVNAVFYGALRLRNGTTRSLEAAAPVTQALARLRRDLRGLVLPGGTLAPTFQSSDVSTMEMASSGTRSAGPSFYSNTGKVEEGAPWGEVQQVTYYLRESTNRLAAGQDLIRAVRRNLLAQEQEPPDEEWLMSGVQRIQFSFHSGTQWRDSWDSTAETNSLPRAVRVELQLAQEDRTKPLRPPIRLVVPVIVVAPTNTASAEGGAQ